MLRKYLVVLPLMLLLASCNRDPQVQARRFVENGNKFFEKAKYKEASIMYRRALQRDLRYGEGYYRLGLVDIKLGLYGDAVRALNRAVELQPKNADAAVKLADIYILATSQDPGHAAQLLKEVKELADHMLQQDPNQYEAHRLLGQLGLMQNDAKAAVKEFEIAQRLKPGQNEVALGFFQALISDKQYPQAEVIGKELIARDKTYAPIYDLLYVHYMGQNRIPEAEQVLKQKIQNNPKQSNFLLQLAGHYLYNRQRSEMDALMKRLDNEQEFPDGHLLAGDFLFFRAREFELARQQYEAGMKAFPKDKPTYEKRMVELLATVGRSTDASQLVAQILRENPKDDNAKAMRAALMLQTGDIVQINQAAAELQALVAKTPDNHLLHFNLARAYMAKRDFDQARLQLEAAIKIRGDFVLARQTLAAVYMQQNQPGKALKEAEDVIAMNPNDIAPRLVRSSALMQIGDRDKARRELDTVLRMAPNNADARYQAGLMAWQDKDYKAAEARFRDILAQDPKDLRGLVGMVETLASEKKMGDAIATMKNVIAGDPQRNDYRLVLANLYGSAQQYDDAIRLFNELLKTDPRNAEVLLRMAEAQKLKGDINASIETYRRAAQAAPGDLRPPLNIAQLLDGTGRRELAKPLYEQVLKIDPEQGIALNNLAYIMADEGVDLNQAMTMAQKARQKMPNAYVVKDTLGYIYVKKNLSDDAIRTLQDAVKDDPKNPTFRYHLALALLQKGNRPQARRELETAMRNAPGKDEAAKINELLATL